MRKFHRRRFAFLKFLDASGVHDNPNASFTSSRPDSIISKSSAASITRDSSEAGWEEIDNLLHRKSVMTLASMVSMALAGIIAATGILTNSLRLVIGAMIIAPDFEPISRIALVLASGSMAWQRGLSDASKGYISLIIGAAAATLVIQSLGYSPANTKETYLPSAALLSYWSSISSTSMLASAAAGLAGAILLITMRSVLTAGVMVALALVPAASMVGIGLMSGGMDLVGKGLARLAVDLGLVFTTSLIVFGWKRYRVEKRRMSM